MIRRAVAGVSVGNMHRRIALPLAAFLLPLAYVGTAHAVPDEICLPEADPTPDWWSPGLGALRRESRWVGADVREETNGTRNTRLRSMWSADYDKIFVEVRVQGDNSLDEEDAFIMAISDAAAELPELYIEMHPNTQCPVWGDCSAGVELDASSILYAAADPSPIAMDWDPLTEINPSVDFEIQHPWIRTTRTGSTYTWTLSFAMTVPTTDGDFMDRRIYGNAVAYDPGVISGTYYEMPVWCTSASPISDTCLVYSFGHDTLPEDMDIYVMNDSWPLVEAGACTP